MPGRFGSAAEARLAVTIRRKEVERRKAREAARLAGIEEVYPPYHPHKPYKASGFTNRTFYAIKVQSGFVGALMVVTGLLHAPMHGGDDSFSIPLSQQETITMEEIAQTRQEQPPPPPPRPPVPVEVPDDAILEDDELSLDATLDLSAPIADLPPPPPAAEPEDEFEQEFFVAVEEPPVMIGGLAALNKLVKYPEIARQAGVEGRVTVEFIVDEYGNVTNPIVLRGIGAGCDAEALRVIQLMKFTPGKQRQQNVKVKMATSVNFRLS